MYKIILSQLESKKSIFTRNEITHLKLFCTAKDYEIPDVVNFAFANLKGMAIVEVKNDLVYNLVKKQLKKIANEAGNEKPNPDLSKESE